MTKAHLGAAAVAAAIALAATPSLQGQGRTSKPEAIAGGNGTMYIGTYRGEIEVYDEASEKLVDRISLASGIPRSITPSPDRTRFYALNSRFEEIEVVDIASRKTIDRIKLSEGNKHIRVTNLQADPGNKFLILMYRMATKLIDRWEIGPPTIQQYDLGSHQFTRTIPWPRAEERETVNMRLGPDGKHLFIFGDEVTVLETANFTEVESWPYAQPAEAGMGRIDLGPSHDFYDPPGTFTGLFTMLDPVQRRRLMGIGRIDLAARKVDFRPLGPATAVGAFAKSPDGKRAYGLVQEIGHYEMWTFDLERNAVAKRTTFDGRPRMGLRVSSNGRLVYVYVAGATVDIWDAASHTYLRTMPLGGDQTTELFVVPRAATAATAR